MLPESASYAEMPQLFVQQRQPMGSVTICYLTPFHEENPLVQLSQFVPCGTGLGELPGGLVHCPQSLLVVPVLVDLHLGN